MVDIYVKLIICRPQRRTIHDVPETLKEAVKKRLKEQGYDENGDPLL